MADQRRVGDARIVEPARVGVVEAVAGRHVEPRILHALELREPRTAGIALRELRVDLLRRAALDERAGDPQLDREPREPAKLGVGPEERDVDPGDHLRDVLVGDVRQVRLAELGERHVRAVAEQEELEVVLPHQIVEPQRLAVGVEDGAVARLLVAERDVVGLVLVERRHVQLGELGDQRLHLRAPLAVQLVPVLVVVAGAALKVLGAGGHLRGVGDGVARDVDVAVDAAPVDPHGGRDGEDTVLPGAERLVGGVDADRVERRHRDREVHRVPEPEALFVLRAPRLVEAGVVRVHVLPALAARRRLHLVRARERTDACWCRHLSSWGRWPICGFSHPDADRRGVPAGPSRLQEL